MFKKSFVLITVLAMLIALPYGAAFISANDSKYISVPNGDFEADAVGNNGVLTNWYNLIPDFEGSSTHYYGIATKSDGVNANNKALVITDGLTTSSVAIGSEKIPVTPGKTYQFIFDYISGRGIYHSVAYYNQEGLVYKGGQWVNPTEGDTYGLSNEAASTLVLLTPGANGSFMRMNTTPHQAPEGAAYIRLVFNTTAYHTFTSYFDNVRLEEVLDETPQQEGIKKFVNVPNPGFERGPVEDNGVIPGWFLMGVSEGTSIIDENLYYGIRNNFGKDDSGRGLYVHDNKGANTVGFGINVVSDKFFLPAEISGLSKEYTLEFDFNTTVRASSIINYYNAVGQVWNGSAWKNITNAYSEYIAADAATYKSYDYYQAAISSGGPGANVWATRKRTMTAPAGTVAVRLGFISAPGHATSLKVDNVRFYYLDNKDPQVISSIDDQTKLLGEEITLDLSEYFQDPDGQDLTYTAVNGKVTDGIYKFLPGKIQTYEETITAKDPYGGVVTESFAVTTQKNEGWVVSDGSLPVVSKENLTASAFAFSKEGQSIKTLGELAVGDTLKVKTSVNNISSAPAGVTLVLIKYDESGIIAEFKTWVEVVPSGSGYEIDYDYVVSDTKGKIEVLLWDSFTKMNALVDPGVLN